MSIAEAARILGVSRMTIYARIREGVLVPEDRGQAYRPGKGPVRLPRAQVEALKPRGQSGSPPA